MSSAWCAIQVYFHGFRGIVILGNSHCKVQASHELASWQIDALTKSGGVQQVTIPCLLCFVGVRNSWQLDDA